MLSLVLFLLGILANRITAGISRYEDGKIQINYSCKASIIKASGTGQASEVESALGGCIWRNLIYEMSSSLAEGLFFILVICLGLLIPCLDFSASGNSKQIS